MESISDILGVIGVAVILLCYLLLQLGRMSATTFIFSFSNFVGSILILISLWYHWNFASVLIEVAWLFISAYGIYKVLKNPDQKQV